MLWCKDASNVRLYIIVLCKIHKLWEWYEGMKDRQPVKAQNDSTEDEGFIRLTTDEVKNNLVDVVARVMIQGERIVLQQAGEEVAAIIPRRELERLDALMYEMKPGPYLPEDEEYYDEGSPLHIPR